MKAVELTLPILNTRIQRKIRATLTIIIEKTPNDRAVPAVSTVQEERLTHATVDLDDLSNELEL